MAKWILGAATAMGVAAVAAGVWPVAASAQEAPPPTDAAPQEPAAPGEAAQTQDAPPDAPSGATQDAPVDDPVDEPPAEPEITREMFRDWEVRCAVEPRRCVMVYLAADANDNPVADIRIERLPDGQEAVAGFTVVTPLGTLLSNGLVIQIDRSEPLAFPYSFCSRSGCFARFGVTDAQLDAFRRGAQAVFVVASVNNPQQAIPLNVSLSGFTAAFNALAE